MDREADQAVILLARALSDPARIRIAATLIDRQRTLEEIAADLGLRLADISRHLSLLRDCGLVVEALEDRVARYSLDLNELRRISRAAFATAPSSSPEADGDAWEQKVLRDFVKNGRLTAIPASHKKKLVVLRWLATLVPPDARLTEREISALLEHYHPDFATLRRELVDNRLLDRERGIYWRAEPRQER